VVIRREGARGVALGGVPVAVVVPVAVAVVDCSALVNVEAVSRAAVAAEAPGVAVWGRGGGLRVWACGVVAAPVAPGVAVVGRAVRVGV